MLPLILSVAGSLLPSVVSALAGAKTEEEARQAVKPKYEAMVARMIGAGKGRNEAVQAADEAIKGALAEEMNKGALPGWAEALLGVAGGIGGWAAGAKLAAKGLAKAAQVGVKGGQAVSQTAGKAESAAAARPKLPAPNMAEAETVDITRLPDEMLTPFPKRAAAMGPDTPVQDAEFRFGGLERRAPIGIEQQPTVGSAPPAQPMSAQEEFRRFLAQEERASPQQPPSFVRPFPARLGYDEASDMNAQMRNHPELF
jgi:hypothetical protein